MVFDVPVHRIHTPQVRFGYVRLTVSGLNYVISKPLVRRNDQLYEDDLLSSLGFQFLVDVQVCDEGMYDIGRLQPVDQKCIRQGQRLTFLIDCGCHNGDAVVEPPKIAVAQLM